MHPDTRGTRSSTLWMTPQWWDSFINEESVYREEVNQLEGGRRENNLVLNGDKTKEMIIDLRRSRSSQHQWLHGGESGEHQVPWSADVTGPNLE